VTQRDGNGGWISDSTEVQYSRISGNWSKYYNRLRNIRGRKHIRLNELLELHEHQQGLCALTGEPMTCELSVGTVSLTNASIDRIDHGGDYSLNNIRLVCRIANIMRWTMSDEELLNWCRKVTMWND
jgi:hypothetical protein